jgi:hypothetical protein
VELFVGGRGLLEYELRKLISKYRTHTTGLP